MSELPSNWAWSTIGAVTDYIQRGKSPKYADQSSLPVINQKCIRWNELQLQHLKYIHPDQIDAWDELRHIRPDDILWNSTGTGTVGRAYLVKDADCRPTKVVDSHVTIVRAATALNPRYLFNWIKSPAVQSKIEEMCDGTTNQIELSRTAIAATAIPVAPEGEQTRIADQLDKLLARIQSCNDRLDAIPALLKRFRQAVLNAAISGALTEDWRTLGKSHVAGMMSSAEFRNCVRDSGQLSYQVTPTADSASLDSGYAPSEWSEVRLSDVIVEMRNGLSAKPSEMPPGARVLRISAVRAGRLDLGDHRYLEISERDATQYSLRKNDLLFTRYNGSLEFVGVCAMLRSDANGYVYPDKLIRVRVDESKANAQFIETAFGSEPVRQQIENYVKSSAGQKGVSGADLKATKFMLPPLAEQAEIVRRVEALFKLAARIEARYTAARAQAQRLSPLLLAKAFRGELVQQDPQDEPASVLLERIAAATPVKARTSRGRPRIKPERQLPLPDLQAADWASLPDGAWSALADPDGFATMVGVAAVLRAWGKPVPEREARLAALFCLQPSLFTAVLPDDEAKQWSRLISDEARPLPAQVLSFQPAINSHWGRAIKGMRARGDLIEDGAGSNITWALGASAASIETAGWPDGRAGFVVAYLRAHGADSVLPLLETSAQEFADVRAA